MEALAVEADQDPTPEDLRPGIIRLYIQVEKITFIIKKCITA